MIRHMFVFGVILPTAITIALFIGFLVCWFKFNMHERLFRKKKLFSKQLKHAMAAHRDAVAPAGGGGKAGHYTVDQTRGNGAAGGGGGGGGGLDREAATKGAVGSGAASGVDCSAGSLQKKHRHYENCGGSGGGGGGGMSRVGVGKCVMGGCGGAADDDHDHDHSVGEDPEAALCAACEDEEHARALTGFINPNLCPSPTNSVMAAAAAALPARGEDDDDPGADADNDGDDEDDDEEDDGEASAMEEHSDAECERTQQRVRVKQVGSMFQHTFHFPASECSHVSNSLVVDSEDGGSEDGNYGHFVPISQLLRDPKAKQFYAVARTGTDSPCSVDLSDGGGGMGGMSTCSDSGHLITGM